MPTDNTNAKHMKSLLAVSNLPLYLFQCKRGGRLGHAEEDYLGAAGEEARESRLRQACHSSAVISQVSEGSVPQT